MRKQYLNALAIELFVLIIALFQFFILKNFNYFIFLGILLALAVIYSILFKVDVRAKMQSKELLLMVLISCMGYYIIKYSFGFATGFIYSTYSKSLKGILTNVITSVVFILISEHLRNIVIEKGKYFKSIVVLSVIVFAALELVTQISLVQLIDRKTILQIAMVIALPTFCKHIFLTFSTYYTGKFNSIIYQLFMTIPAYLLPIFPDFGDYINSLLNIGIPIITLLISARTLFYKREGVKNAKEYYKFNFLEKAFTFIGIIFLALIIYLISDRGTFYAMAIGSQSMTGTIEKGDVVIINKKKKEYEVGDILAADVNGTIIVHRITEKNKIEGGYVYTTKGDANNAEDFWEVKESMIKGKAVLRVRYLGWPTIKLSEYLRKE